MLKKTNPLNRLFKFALFELYLVDRLKCSLAYVQLWLEDEAAQRVWEPLPPLPSVSRPLQSLLSRVLNFWQLLKNPNSVRS